MPWLRADVRDQRLAFVLALQQPGARLATVCAHFGISRPTGYRWRQRFAAQRSVAALADHSRRPQHQPRRTAASVEAAVVAARATYGWGGRKLAVMLATRGLTLGHATIDRILARHGVESELTGQRAALQRFERAQPNALWQMDFKGQYPLRGSGWCYPFTVLDDHSRFALAVVAAPAQTGAGVQAALTACFERYGVPDQILMDHGTPWWTNGNGHGLSRCAIWLLDQGITLRYSGVRHPQTQGKIERFHRTLGARLRQWGVPTDLAGFTDAFARFRDEYNTVRPHAALQYHPPASRYTPSPRPYVACPPAWPYPAPCLVLPVDGAGFITWHRQRIFVCEALAQREVGCQVLEDLLLIQYRTLYVRQYDCRTGRSLPLLQPLDRPQLSRMS